MGAGRGLQGGALAPPWNLKMMTSYTVIRQTAPNVLLAPPTLALIVLKFSI